jgi:peptidylprolyl isomerase/peptidyl-prolyl cis-trans isomerase D
MAILGKIRSQGLILILVIALALFAFIIQGLLTSNGASKDAILGVVGDTEIDRVQFGRRVEATMQQRGANASTLQAVNSVWNAEVRDAILKSQIEAAGIDASEEAVKTQIKGLYNNSPLFLDENGQFSEVKLNTFVTNLKKNDPAQYRLWLQDVENAAGQVKQNQFFTLLKSGIIGTQADGEMEYRMANDNRNFMYVQIPFTSIADSVVEITKSEIKAYVSEHKAEFETEAQRDIQYVLFEDKASKEDEDALKADLTKLLTTREEYNENTNQKELVAGLKETTDASTFVNANSDIAYDDTFILSTKLPEVIKPIATMEKGATYGPFKDGNYMKISRLEDKKTIMDSVKNRHILVSYAGAQRSNATRTKEEAQAIADSIFATIGQSSKTYLNKWEYFKENNEIAKGEDLGWTVYSGNARNLAEGYRNFLFENKEGTIGIAESTFGFHIIYLEETKTPVETVQLATIAKEIEASKKTSKMLYNSVQKFQKAITDGEFEAIAKEFNVAVKPVNSLKELDENLPGLQRNRAIVKWAFEDGTDIGDFERFEVPEGYVIAQVTRKTDAGLMTAEEASTTVTPILRNKKKAAMIMEKIRATDVNTIASNQGQNVRSASAVNRKNPTLPGIGEEPMVVGTVFGLDNNQTSMPVVGEKGVYVVKVTGISNAPDLQNYTSDAREVANRTANQSTSQLVEALKKSTEIVDNRATFY